MILYKFLWYSTNFYDIQQISMILYKVLWYSTNFYDILKISMILYKFLWYSTNFYDTLQIPCSLWNPNIILVFTSDCSNRSNPNQFWTLNIVISHLIVGNETITEGVVLLTCIQMMLGSNLGKAIDYPKVLRVSSVPPNKRWASASSWRILALCYALLMSLFRDHSTFRPYVHPVT